MRVPAAMEPAFEKAEEVVSEFFRRRLDTPERGTIEIFGQRYVLVRAASLSIEFFDLVEDLFGKGREQESADFARNILYDLAHAIGKSDARAFFRRMGLEDPIARLSAGPVHFAHTGWAFVDISEESHPGQAEDFYLLYDHPYSFESDAWVRAGKNPGFPVCIMNAGYSSGWCEESFGVELVSSEVLCRAKGDEHCRFIMSHPAAIERMVERYIESEPQLAARMREYQIPDFFVRKRLEDELKQARNGLEHRVSERTEELRQANVRLKQEMAERAEMERKLLQSQKLEALGGLAGGIAHDFNNILTTVRGYTELILEEASAGSPLAQDAKEIGRAAERGARLTSQLLVFSRQQVLEPSVVDLVALVQRLGGMLQRLIGEDIVLKTVVGDGPHCLRADRSQIEQIIINLAINARDAMPRGGTLSIEVSRVTLPEHGRELGVGATPGPKVVLRVHDSGCGMSEETLSHLFEPFYTTKGAGKGTGLGLAVVYGIVKESGGHIVVGSTPGKGTSFTIHFPEVDESPTAEPSELGVEAAPDSRRSILLVEDDASVRGLARTVLEKSGYSVLEAEGPSEALELFAEHQGSIDLLLSDIIMPGMSGVELASRLRSSRPDLRVLFMSGYADDTIARRGGLEPDDAVIKKPFTLSLLNRKIREVLGR